jgi:hypothetical protein
MVSEAAGNVNNDLNRTVPATADRPSRIISGIRGSTEKGLRAGGMESPAL